MIYPCGPTELRSCAQYKSSTASERTALYRETSASRRPTDQPTHSLSAVFPKVNNVRVMENGEREVPRNHVLVASSAQK